MQKVYLSILTFIIISISSSCNYNNTVVKDINNNKSIAITKAHGSSGYEQYKKWILSNDSTIIIYDLYELSLDSAEKIMNIVDGLIISGGPDVNPSLYGEDSMAYICQTPDKYRDSLEYLSIKNAYDNNLPILGICRGQQILNVYFGGSLINDIPSQIGNKIIHSSDSIKANHFIIINNNTNLYKLVKKDSIIVNSSHHQAIKHIADRFIINAKSADGIIESISLKPEINYPNFFLGVQFHPEHMHKTDISKAIANEFIKSLNNKKE